MSEEMKAYWHERLAQNQNLIGTGHRAFNLAYNQALYQRQKHTLETLLRTNKVDPTHKHVLDIGSGTGFYIDYFLNKGAASLTGLDIAPSSVTYLQQTYPEAEFHTVDIGQTKTLPTTRQQFDIISVISVFYHIIEESAFEQALSNVCQALSPGGYLLVSDMFKSTWQLTAGHVQFRTLPTYQQVFNRFDVQVVDILPIYYLMNRTMIPVVMPPILSLTPVTQLLCGIDRWLVDHRFQMGAGLKLLLAKRG